MVLLMIATLPSAIALAPEESAPIAPSRSDAAVAAVPSPEVIPAPSPTSPPLSSPSDTATQPQPTGPTIVSRPTVIPSSHPVPAPSTPPTPTPVAPVPPTVILTATPLSGLAPLTVAADASRSTDASGIVAYLFDFGDGTVFQPIQGAVASHKYCRGGTYRLSVTLTDVGGLRSSAFLYVTVTQPVSPVTC